MSTDVFSANSFFFFHEALRFDEIKDVDVWHDTVRVFSVWDASSSDLLGYFFLDIFARFVLKAC